MKSNLLENGWIQKTVRVKKDYIKLSSYLEFIANKKNITIYEFFNQIFLYSLNKITENGFNFVIEEYKPRRTPKGFVIEKSTDDLIRSSYEFYKEIYLKKNNKKLYVAEYIELLLYIYSIYNLNNFEIEQINIEWGICKKEV